MDDDAAMRVGGGVHLPETISVSEQAAFAGQRPAGQPDEIDLLRTQCEEFLERYALRMPEQHRMMARSHLQETFFWLRAGLQRANGKL